MPQTEAEKRAQKKYDAKRKKLSCSVFLDEYNKITTHAQRKGYKSINSYILDLVRNDIKKG